MVLLRWYVAISFSRGVSFCTSGSICGTCENKVGWFCGIRNKPFRFTTIDLFQQNI